MLTLLAMLLAAANGPPPAVTLAVAPLSAPPVLTFTGRGVADAMAGEAERMGGFQVLGPGELEKRMGRGLLTELLACGVETSCLVDRSRPLGVDRLVAGTLDRTETTYRVHVVYLDLKTGQVIASIEREILIAARRLKTDMARATPPFLRGEKEATGVLVVTTEEPGAKVLLNDELAGVTPLRLTLKPGKYRVQVFGEGFLQQDVHFVDVEEGKESADRVRLIPVPGRARKVAAGPAPQLAPRGPRASSPS
jgi:hypothetical protein